MMKITNIGVYALKHAPGEVLRVMFTLVGRDRAHNQGTLKTNRTLLEIVSTPRFTG